MFAIINKIVESVGPKHDDDYIDRMNYSFTALLYFGIILIIGCKQYGGERIQCMISPTEATWEQAIEEFCYHNTFYTVPETTSRFPKMELRNYDKLSFYKWVPLFLFIPLCLLLIPRNFWSSFSRRTGYSARNFFGKMKSCERDALAMETKVNGTNENIINASKCLSIILENSTKLKKKQKGGFLPPTFTIAYMCFKLCNLINGILQFVLVNLFFKTPFFEFFNIMLRKFRDAFARIHSYEGIVEENVHFPRIVYCTYMRRDDTSSSPMYIETQCYLGANLFHEYIYITICVWAIILTCLNCLNIIYWLLTVFSSSYAKKFVLFQLHYARTYLSEDFDIFATKYLTLDCITSLRLVSQNLGNEISSNMISYIYKKHKLMEIPDDAAFDV